MFQSFHPNYPKELYPRIDNLTTTASEYKRAATKCILYYQKIIVALTEMDRIMKEIDKVEIE